MIALNNRVREKYFWHKMAVARKWSEREIQNDYAALRKLKSTLLQDSIDYLLSLPSESRSVVHRSRLVAAEHHINPLLCSPSREEQEVNQQFIEGWRNTRASRAFQTKEWHDSPKLNPILCREAMMSHMERIWKKAPLQLSACSFEYDHVLESWHILTRVDYAKTKIGQAEMWHDIYLGERGMKDCEPLDRTASYSSWLGLGPMVFDILENNNIDELFSSLAHYCGIFKEALPELLENLV